MASNRQNMAIVTIGSVPLIMTLGNSMLIPVLPAMQESLGISSFQVSLTISVYSIAAAIFIPIFGYLSDRFSRKTILLPSLILASLGALLAAFAASSFESYSWILVGRIIQGIGAAGTAPVAMALAGDLFKGSEQSRVLGIVEASNGSGKVLSPIFGSLLGLLVWYAVLYSFPILCLISILLTWIFIKENDFPTTPPTFKNYMYGLLSVFKKEGRWLIACYFVGGVCLFTLFGILFFLSDVLEDYHKIEGIMKGLILAIPLLFLVTTSYITGSKMGKSFERMKILMLIGFSLMTLSYVGLIFINQLILFLSVLAVSSIGAGLILPCINSFITGSVGKDQRGFVTSIYSSIRFIGVAAGPPIFARLMEWSMNGMFFMIAILSFVTGLIVLFFIKVKGMNGKDNKKTVFRYNYL